MKSTVALALPRASFSTPKASSTVATGLTKPIASSTRSALSICSLPATSCILPSFHSTRTVFRPRDLALLADELLGGDRRTRARSLPRGWRRGAQLDRPVGPGQRACSPLGRLGHQLELGDADGAVAVAGAHAVGAGVAAADHDHVLALGAQLVLDLVARVDACSAAAGTPSRNGRRRGRGPAPAGRATARRRRSAPRRRSPSCSCSGVTVSAPVGDLGALARQPWRRRWITPVRNSTPSAFICSTRRSMCDFSILKSGMP